MNNPQSAIVNRQSPIVAVTAKVVSVLAVGLSLFQLYTAGLGAMTAMVQRSVHLGAILALVFILRPPFSKARKDRLTVWLLLDLLLAATTIYCCFYVFYYLN